MTNLETHHRAANAAKRQLTATQTLKEATQTLKEATVGNLGVFLRYLEGDAGQGEGLEVSLLPLQGAEDEAFLTGADVVVPVAVQRTHTGREPGEKTRSGIKGLQTESEVNPGRPPHLPQNQ